MRIPHSISGVGTDAKLRFPAKILTTKTQLFYYQMFVNQCLSKNVFVKNLTNANFTNITNAIDIANLKQNVFPVNCFRLTICRTDVFGANVNER